MHHLTNKDRNIILVLCHTILHDSFRPVLTENFTSNKYITWQSSEFVINMIIERQAELPEGIPFATTSKNIWEEFENKFILENPSQRRKEAMEIFKNSIDVIDKPTLNAVSNDESVFVIGDALFNRSNYTPILISNAPSKKEKAETFYKAKNPDITIPFQILTATEAKMYLQGMFPSLGKLVINKPWPLKR